MDGSGFRVMFKLLPWLGGALVFVGLGVGIAIGRCA